MRSGRGETLSIVDGGGEVTPTRGEPHLFLVIQSARPAAPPARVRLGGLDELVITRGSQRRIEDGAGGRRLQLVVADARMSSNHATFRRGEDGWRVVDGTSKNGTRVEGARVDDALLRDGDQIEIGQTHFVYREALPTRADAPVVLDGGELASSPGMATMLPALAERFAELSLLAASKTSLVIRGASGTGKELLARVMHQRSRRGGPFVAVNCAALPEGLIESELFGHVRGAFSGADRAHDGLITTSAGGTLFLDEIGDLPRAAQAKLLRVLQEQEVRPVGATASTPVDLRVLAATHRDLEQACMAGEFREDLLARLGGMFVLPPLCERREDAGLVISALLAASEDPRAAGATFTSEAMRAMLRYDWPRNVRELEKCVERALALADGAAIDVRHLPEEVRVPGEVRARRGSTPGAAAAAPGAAALGEEDRVRREQLIALLKEHGGNVAAVARAMSTVRSQVQRWMKRYGLEPGSRP